jgi:hypothetical protein
VQLEVLVLALDHVQDSVRPKVILALSVAKPLFAVFLDALDHGVRLVDSTVGAGVLRQGGEVVGFNRPHLRSLRLGH